MGRIAHMLESVPEFTDLAGRNRRVDKEKPATRFEDAGSLGDEPVRVREVMRRNPAGDDIEGRIFKRKLLGVGLGDADVRQAQLGERCLDGAAITGPRKLRGRPLDSRDIRSGMALIAAALAAEGESTLHPLETVERGYAAVVERLNSLGARVAREEAVRDEGK